ncbi:unnamed protein product [Rotaria sp. Silwood2]|nr:unnamed protein product [Rotaria sp. Silwood2]
MMTYRILKELDEPGSKSLDKHLTHCIKSSAYGTLTVNKNKKTINISSDELIGLKSLLNDKSIALMKADNGRFCVLGDKEQYVQKVNQLLSTGKIFQKINYTDEKGKRNSIEYVVNKMEAKLNYRIAELKRAKKFTKVECKVIEAVATGCPILFCQPKVHKTGMPLHVQIIRERTIFLTTIFKKKTHSGQFLHWHSCQAKKDQLDRWREYFSELLNVNSVVDPHVIDHISTPVIPTAEQDGQNEPSTLEEIGQALKQMKNRKVSENDDISTDILKPGGVPVLKWLHEIFVDIWQNEEIVDDCILAILIRLFKNQDDKKQCDNYRGISLLVVASKLFTRVILNRIQKLIDKQLLEQEAGFRSNRSTIDQIFILKMTMEKSREFNRPLFMCFIDIQKACDPINRELLWKICQHYCLTDKVVRLIKLI